MIIYNKQSTKIELCKNDLQEKFIHVKLTKNGEKVIDLYNNNFGEIYFTIVSRNSGRRHISCR